MKKLALMVVALRILLPGKETNMKKALSLFIPIILLLFPTVISAKSAQSTFWALGPCKGKHTYNDIPFQLLGATMFVRIPPEGDPQQGDILLLDTYPMPAWSSFHAKEVHFINTSAWVLEFINDIDVGQIRVCYTDDSCDSQQLTIGVNTAEWSYELPWNIDNLEHSPPESAWTEWFYDNGEGPYPSHHFYASVKADPEKVLDRIELELIENDYPYNNSGVYIEAITVETIDVPPKVTGGGMILCGDGNPCTFGVSAQWKEGKVWPSANFFFMDLDSELIFNTDDIRRFGIASHSDPNLVFFSGCGQVNGVTGYGFNLRVEDNGNPGGGNDKIIRLRIDLPNGEVYFISEQPLLGGNITVTAE